MLTGHKYPIPCITAALLLGVILFVFVLKQPAGAASQEQTPQPEVSEPLSKGVLSEKSSEKTEQDDSNPDTDSDSFVEQTADTDVTINSIPIHVYFNFYDSSTGDINHTIGLYSMEVPGSVYEDCIKAEINPWPGMFDYQEVDGFPQVLINYGDVSGREQNISAECSYNAGTGHIQIPSKYQNEYLTVKCIMSEQSTAYQRMIPDAYKVIKTASPMLRAPASDTSQFEVLTGSGNNAFVYGSTDSYKAGDVITISNAYIQTLNKNEDSSLYAQTGTSAYMGYKGEAIGYAISFTCDSAPLFSNLGNPGGTASSRFPVAYNSYVTIPFSERNWMYARCITTDSNYFDGNPKFSSGKITVTSKAADGTLTCWVELYLTGPRNENAQNVGMYFTITPQKLQSLTITKRKYLTLTKLTGASFSLWSYDGTSYGKRLGYFTDNADGSYTFADIDVTASSEGRFLIKEEKAPAGYQLPYAQTNEADRADYNAYGGRTIQFINGEWKGTFSGFKNFQDKEKTGVDLIIHKKIHTQDVYFSHGIPTFFFHIQGTDERGKSHSWIRSVVFTPQYVSYAAGPDGTVSQPITLQNVPPGTYTIKELPVSRFVLTNITAQTDNVTVYKVNKAVKYEGISPITGSARVKLTDTDGEVTFENRKITWDKYGHNHIVINQFSLAAQ